MMMAKDDDTTHPLSCAEIETNAPYQPFHTDSRVTFHVYAKQMSDSASPIGHQDLPPWAFGESIPATKVSAGSSSPTTLEDQNPSLQKTTMTRMENFINVEGTEEGGQQVIFTTRRKRRTARSGRAEDSARAEDEFFEDDCEVVDFAEDRV